MLTPEQVRHLRTLKKLGYSSELVVKKLVRMSGGRLVLSAVDGHTADKGNEVFIMKGKLRYQFTMQPSNPSRKRGKSEPLHIPYDVLLESEGI